MNTGWLGLNIAHAATAANIDQLARRSTASKRRVSQARTAACITRARRHIIGLAGALRRTA